MDHLFKVGFSPEWREIDRIVAETVDFLTKRGLSSDSTSTCVMIITELVENALKYGKAQPADESFGVSVELHNGSVVVEVTNPIDASSSRHIERLDYMVQWIRGYQDPFEAYIQRLKEVAKKSLSDPESGLGLARIAYEGGSVLDFFVNESDVLNVSAMTQLH